jgi:hypothetical protein
MTLHIHFTLLYFIVKIHFTMVSTNRSKGETECANWMPRDWLAFTFTPPMTIEERGRKADATISHDDWREKKEGRCNNFQHVHISTF